MTSVCQHHSTAGMRLRPTSPTETSSADELSIEPAPSTTKNFRARSESSCDSFASRNSSGRDSSLYGGSNNDSLDRNSGHGRCSIDEFRSARRQQPVDDEGKHRTDHNEQNNVTKRLSIDEFRARRERALNNTSMPVTARNSPRYRRGKDSDDASVYSMDDVTRLRTSRESTGISVYSGSGCSSVSGASRRSTDTMSRSSSSSSGGEQSAVDRYLNSSSHMRGKQQRRLESNNSVRSTQSHEQYRAGVAPRARDATTSSADSHTSSPHRRSVRGGRRGGTSSVTNTTNNSSGSSSAAGSSVSLSTPRPRPIPEASPTIEVAPGLTARLRGAKESYECVRLDFVTSSKCFCCSLDLVCIMDASYVLCPICKVVGPLDEDSAMNGNGGVALGITPEVLAQWRSEIAAERGGGARRRY